MDYELLQESEKEPKKLDWITRACQDRALKKDEKHDGTATNHLRDRVLAEDILFTKTISVRGRKAKVGCETRGRRQPRESRTAEVAVRAARVTLRAPWRHDRKLRDISVNVVLVAEINPPAGDFFRTLKSGCRVEGRRFEHIDRVLPCLAVYLIVTWRTLYVCRLGREFPEISCEAVFEPAEWKSVHHFVYKAPPPSTPPTLQEMVRLVARLGGYVNRKRTDEPGPQTVWLGLQRTHDITNCWLTFGPEGKHEKILV